MSNEKMREEFELAVTERFGKQHDGAFDRFINGDYKRPSIMNLWWAWQASRAALCVELPQVGICAMTNDLIGYTRGIRDCRSAIESTGVRIR